MNLRDTLLAISVPVLWGLGFTFSKIALAEFPPILLMTFRFALTALTLVWFVPIPRRILRQIFFIALVSAAIQYGLTFYGLKFLDASTAALVVQLEVPFLAILGAVFLKEAVGLQRIIGILISFAGVIMIVGEPRLAGNHLGIILVTCGAFTWAAGQIMIRKLGTVGGFTLIAWVAVFATPQLFLASLLIEGNPIPPIAAASWKVWAIIAYLGLIMTAVGYGIWYHLLGRYPVNHVGPFLLLLPVVAIAASVTLLDEKLTWWLISGGVTVILGVGIIIFGRSEQQRMKNDG